MQREDIYRTALLCFNVSYDRLNEDSFEVEYCENFIRSAELSVARLHEWTFLQKRRKYEDVDKVTNPPFKDMGFCYEKPSDMLNIYFINGTYDNSIQMIGNHIYVSEENPEVVYITSDVDYDTFPYPDDYGYLIAYQLAYEIADFIAPDKSSYKNMILQKLQMKLELLRRTDLENTRRKNPDRELYIV